MSLNRVLKYVNYLIALLLVAAIAAVYWFGYRVLPKTSGDISAPLRRPARVVRDAHGTPHIFADTAEDAVFLQGYVTAQDRLWQMDALRRLAGGTLAEVAGAAALESDRESRQLQTRRIADRDAARLDPRSRALFAEYARGVNYFIETHRGSLPVEFTLMQYDPRPWTVADSVLAAVHMDRELTTSWRDELQKRAMLAAAPDPKLVEQLWGIRAAHEVAPGSNAWVVSGKYTASGKPLLANDTHLQWSLPSTWYMVHISCPQFDVAGVSLPGLPSVIIGHNRRIAWGVTNLHFDVQDFYREQIEPRTGQYAFRGQVLQAAADRELIAVKGRAPVEFHNWTTVHGPLWTSDGREFLTLRWAAADPAGFDFPMFDLAAAGNWNEFRAALRRFPGPAQNFVYADVDGNIGYQAAGRLPIRRNANGDVPVDGSSGNYEWEGVIPFDELPSVYNPPGGMIISANNNPFPADYKYRVNGNFGPNYRPWQIRELLRARAGWKAGDMLRVQKDVYSSFFHFLAGQLVRAFDRKGNANENLRDATAVLRSWNGQMEKGTAAPVIVSLVYDRLRNAIAERAAPGKSQPYQRIMAGPIIEDLLTRRPREWFADWDGVLLKSFAGAVEDGKAKQGGNPRRWDYGAYLELELRHPVLNALPVIGKYFNVGPFPMSGSSTSVKQTTPRMGPSMRFVADFSNWDRSLLNITIGQSGQPLSGHYKDEWWDYYGATSYPLAYLQVTGEELKFVPSNR